MLPERLADLPTPCLVLDLDRLERNLERMAARCRKLGVRLRPHFKTHKCVEIARLQLAAGAEGLTVATLEEAAVLQEAGIDDLTWAFPVIPPRMDEIETLAGRGSLQLVVDSTAGLEALAARGVPFRVWLEVDPGYHRSGLEATDPLLVELARRLSSHATLRFEGLLTHEGQTYHTPGREQILAAANQGRDQLLDAARRLRQQGLEVPALSLGSTPGMSVVEDLDGIDEARPGNYALYDFTQVALGSCTTAECAVTVVSSVISSSSAHAVCDAGALALSKDPGPGWRAGPAFGEVFADYDAARLDPDLRLTALSQEHGFLSRPCPVGTPLRILPNHSCLTVACWDEFLVVRGDRIVDSWTIHRRRGPTWTGPGSG